MKMVKTIVFFSFLLLLLSTIETEAQLTSIFEGNACSKMLQQVQSTFKRRFDQLQSDINRRLRETSSNPTLQAQLKKLQSDLRPAQNEYGLCILRATSPISGCMTRVGACIAQYSTKLGAFENELQRIR